MFQSSLSLIFAMTILGSGEKPVLEKLWERPLQVEGKPVPAGNLILLPCGIRLVALDAQTGREVWSYLFEEDRAGLRVPMRIQGLATVRLRRGRGLAIAIGATEIHGIGLLGGNRLWTHREKLCCTLALGLAGDQDGDRVADAVTSGCNFAVCASGADGSKLWEFPISGRRWWASCAGDLTGDGVPEVLVHALGSIHAVRSMERGEAECIWSVEVPFQPLAAFPVERDVILLFPGGLAERREGRRGRRIWSWRGPPGPVLDSALSPGGSELLILGGEALHRISCRGGGAGKALPVRARSGCLAVSRGVALLGGTGGEIAVLDLPSGEMRATAGIAPGEIEAVLFPAGPGRDTAVAVTRRVVCAVRMERVEN